MTGPFPLPDETPELYIQTDVPLTRRKTAAIILSRWGVHLWKARSLGEAFDWAYEKDITRVQVETETAIYTVNLKRDVIL